MLSVRLVGFFRLRIKKKNKMGGLQYELITIALITNSSLRIIWIQRISQDMIDWSYHYSN